MGVTTTDNDEQSASEMAAAAKPKERQFQVVPVPGTFTRGRWKCWDYKDKTLETGEIIDFTDKSEKPPATINVAENAASFVASAGTQSEAINHTLSEPRLMATTDSAAAISQPIDVPSSKNESSTIVVTSIAPPSVTPVHGTPCSTNISPVINNAEVIETKGRSVSVVDGGDYVSSREKSPSLPPTVSAPALSKIPAAAGPNVATVAPQVAPGQLYVTPSATAPNLQPLQEAVDPNLIQQPLAPAFAPDPAVATTVALNVNEMDDSFTKP